MTDKKKKRQVTKTFSFNKSGATIHTVVAFITIINILLLMGIFIDISILLFIGRHVNSSV